MTDTPWGTWLDEADVRFILPRASDRVRVRVLSPLRWRDLDGGVHTVPAGFESDGASVPRLMWSLAGGPLDGAYVRATILHDFQCAHRVGTSADAHLRFYRSMRADRVTWLVARVYYRVVAWFGPHWPSLES